MSIKVAVIGTGAAGICALRHLRDDPKVFHPVAFEKNREVGGLWNYSDHTEKDEYGLPCFASVYKNLRINLPTVVMCFPDVPFQKGHPSFPGYAAVKKYLDNYAKKFDLNKYIKFQTMVTNVVPLDSSEGLAWLVTSRNLQTNETTTQTFDQVIVCNGKEGVPIIPDIPGLDKFKGTWTHTKNIRDVKAYSGKNILLVGASYSAQDIIFEMGPFVPKMYVSHRSKEPLRCAVPDNVKEVPFVKEILPNGVILENGECREVDVIILATGYHYSFPFLSEECELTVKEERIQPLYNQMFHIKYPSLSFIGILKGILHFQNDYAQAQYICAVMKGDFKLPSAAEMYRQEEEDYQKRVMAHGLPPKSAHEPSGPQYRQYVENLTRQSKLRPITEGALKIWDIYAHLIHYEFGNLKQRTFRLIGDNDYEMST